MGTISMIAAVFAEAFHLILSLVEIECHMTLITIWMAAVVFVGVFHLIFSLIEIEFHLTIMVVLHILQQLVIDASSSDTCMKFYQSKHIISNNGSRSTVIASDVSDVSHSISSY
jgi:hypothetical protein